MYCKVIKRTSSLGHRFVLIINLPFIFDKYLELYLMKVDLTFIYAAKSFQIYSSVALEQIVRITNYLLAAKAKRIVDV